MTGFSRPLSNPWWSQQMDSKTREMRKNRRLFDVPFLVCLIAPIPNCQTQTGLSTPCERIGTLDRIDNGVDYSSRD